MAQKRKIKPDTHLESTQESGGSEPLELQGEAEWLWKLYRSHEVVVPGDPFLAPTAPDTEKQH